MSPVDHAWLEMDGPHNPMVVASITEFDGVADAETLARDFYESLVRVPRFRQRVIDTRDGCAWLEDDALHEGYHVRVVRLPEPATDKQLRAAIGAELSRGLDRALPLWRIVAYPRRGNRVTILFRAHHAIADGVALMQMMMRMGQEPSPELLNGNGHANGNGNGHRHGPLGGLIRRLETVNDVLESLTELVVDDLRHPGQLTEQVGTLRRFVANVARVVTLPDDNPASLRRAPAGQRAVAWTGKLSFTAVRNFAKKQGVTINDVFLTALAGAFARYLRRADGTLDEKQNLRVSVPVNLRTEADGAVGNGFGLVLIDLPVGYDHWHGRLERIADHMLSLKRSGEAQAVLVALSAAGRLPLVLEKQLVGHVSGKAAAVVSNLPGPRQLLRFGGARVANVVFWPPQTAGVGIGVSFLSYAGHITVGVSADTAQLARPDLLVDDFRAELQSMLGRSPAIRAHGLRRGRLPHRTARSSTGVPHAENQ